MESDNLKKCIFCGQLINNEAIVCQYCGKNLFSNMLNDSSLADVSFNKDLFDKQLITEEEYKNKKAKILGI